MNEEIKIITLGDIFDNIETDKKAFKFLNYIKHLQQKFEQLEKENKELNNFVTETIGDVSEFLEKVQKKDNAIDYWINENKKQRLEIDRLNNIIDTMLEFSFFKEECPLNFGFGDEREEKAQDVFYDDDYCEQNCNDIYKKCWLKYFEKLQKLKENK